MTDRLTEQISRLPVPVRPRPGELTDAYIRRLAHANHLKPSYLYGFLTGSPNWFGKPRIERLASVTGRPQEVLRHVLADAGSPGRHRRPGPGRAPKRIAKSELYQRIRHDSETEGLSMRALVKRHHVGMRTVRAALDNPEPRPRKPLPRRPTAIDPVQHLIDSMIEQGHGPKEIWVNLMDKQEISIPYAAIRQYVWNRAVPDSGSQTRPSGGTRSAARTGKERP
ncbi:hypothetical protein EDD99_5742 [Streptomyces sp. 846.5]|nr:hypothetical protein EDD99_5742 [Streptomyces sp. 846.5]